MANVLFKRVAGAIKEVAAAIIASGEPSKTSEGRASFYEGLQAAAIGDTVSKRTEGIVRLPAASGTVFAKGEQVIWDASAGLAIRPALTGIDASTDYRYGICTKAKVSGELEVECEMNVHPQLPAIPMPFIYEFDCEDGTDETATVKNEHVLVPAEFNKHGLLILGIYGVVTEVFGGGTEDQGIITVRDQSNNTLATLTASNAAADAVGDVIVGTNKLFGATTGDAVKSVAAGEYIDAQVTQKTSGSSVAGKIKVYVLCMPLV